MARFVLFLVILVGLAGHQESAANPNVVKGELDLRDWDFESNGAVGLNGEWQFFWLQFVTPDTSALAGPVPRGTYYRVPAAWSGETADGDELTPQGHATYRLVILLPQDRPPLRLDLPEINMASTVWVNGQPVVSSGIPGTSLESEVARSRPVSVALPDTDEVELLIHVSNFYHMEGGIARRIKVDRADAVLRNHTNQLYLNILTIGALFFVAIHYLVVYSHRRTETEYLLYGMLALMMMIRLIVVNKLPYTLIEHPHVISTRLSYLTVFWIPPLYLAFLRTLFPNEMSRYLCWALFAAAVVGTLVVNSTSPLVFTHVRDIYVALIQVMVVYVVIAIGLACFRRQTDAYLVLLLVVIFGATVIYDTLVYQRLLYANDIGSYGFLVFLFGHAALLGRRAERAFTEEKSARSALADLSDSLQELVDDRTAVLSSKVAQLEEKEVELEQAREIAELTSISKSRFLRAASHDLRQPVHALNLFVDVLETNIRNNNWQRIIPKISESLKSLDQLLIDLGEIGRLDSGLLSPKVKNVCLDDCFQKFSTEFDFLCQEKGISFSVVRTSLWCRTDEEMLIRIVRNLLSNAVKYTRKGGVILGCRRQGQKVRVEVWDTGTGIPGEQQEIIFDEFLRLESARNRSTGVGLGLSIVRQLSALLGHEISVKSRVDRGSVFSITIPRCDPEVAGRRLALESTSPESVEGLRIMVVEDDPMICEAMQEMLSSWGCCVKCFSSINSAAESLSDGSVPDLLISDFHLGNGVNALDAVQRVHAVTGQDIPVLIVTAELRKQELAAVVEREYPVLHKPVESEQLRSSIYRAIRAGEGET